MANAQNNQNVDPTTLYVAEAFVDEGPTMKRIRPRAQGRAFAIRKRTSHITLILEPQGSAPRRKPGRRSNKPKPLEVITKTVKTETAATTAAPVAKKAAPAKKAAAKKTAAKKTTKGGTK